MQTQPLALIQKKNISSEDIKEIVLMLNEPPFQSKISLVDLDEYNTFELGDLVFKIFKFLNPDININAKATPPADIIFHVSEFLRVLSYESDFGEPWQNGLLNGDRKVIYPIYYFLLKNLQPLKKRAYLAKFLVTLDVPAEFSGDPEIKSLN
jgi:intraflagellar transport protein 81